MTYSTHPATPIDQTHHRDLQSWVESANDPLTDFPIQNLPYCTFSTSNNQQPRLGIAIGDRVLDLGAVASVIGVNIGTFSQLSSLSIRDRFSLRQNISKMLSKGAAPLEKHCRENPSSLVERKDVTLHLPAPIRNYTDFYASIHHASTVGAMFRPDNPLLPNYKHVPIGYHGRASSIVASGTPVRRPNGQQAPPDDAPAQGPTFGPCKLLDHELEVGCIIASGNTMGDALNISKAHENILGLCLVNDWSARDVQKWEYQPLGPFLAKNFATSVSPFIVTPEALAPFRCAGSPRSAGDPAPLAYLRDENDLAAGGFDIVLEVTLQSAKMQSQNMAPIILSRGRGFKDMFWTFAQMLTHHASNGCNLVPGDLLASGTVSGATADSRGCMLELTWGGPGKPRNPVTLPTGETRVFLADGDTVTIKGWCERDGYRRIGLGECTGTILPAIM